MAGPVVTTSGTNRLVAVYVGQVPASARTTGAMKRRQRKMHLLIWVLLTPILAIGFVMALKERPMPPMNTVLPDILDEAGD